MSRTKRRWVFSLLLLTSIGGLWAMQAPPTQNAARKLMNNGNYKEAYQAFRVRSLAKETPSQEVARDLQLAVQCLRSLGRIHESDAYLEEVIKTHSKQWRVLQAAAVQYNSMQHWGTKISGKFRRGPNRGGRGPFLDSRERDYVRSMQLMDAALPLAQKDDNKKQVAEFYSSLARLIRQGREAWRLQYLTDLAKLPDFDTYNFGYYPQRGTPVDEDGKPVYHQPAKSWKTAKTDGQRWRWALALMAENDPARLDESSWRFAQFQHQQLGVQTLGYLPRPKTDSDTGTYALHTLKDNETIAQLATGMKRFAIDDEFHFLSIFKKLSKAGPYRTNARVQIANIYQNRRQYSKAAKAWREVLLEQPRHNQALQQLRQIEKNWGTFESAPSFAAGQGAEIPFRFRNGKSVQFTAKEINIQKLLDDAKQYLKSRRNGRADWNQVNLASIGHRLVRLNQKKYVGKEVASWQLKLDPRANHLDRRITVKTPLQDAGAYLVTSKMKDGNETNIVVWVNDMVIVRKQLSNKTWFYVADAKTGTPIDRANVEFFGYRQKSIGGNRWTIETANYAERTDNAGQVIVGQRDMPRNYQWLVVARRNGKLAHLGFAGIWYGNYHDQQYNAVKVYTITDRPVYRPNQKVKFKFWVRRTQYDREFDSQFSKRSCTLRIYDPKGTKMLEKSLLTDEYGGADGEIELAADATLGNYRMEIRAPSASPGQHYFRVEEYKKPEFEVTIDAPTEPIMLGERIKAKVNAKYYFGSPVTNATVKIKVERQTHSQSWYPIGIWDWCYGRGYWWFCYDYPWYPGWTKWVGCFRPHPWWFPYRPNPPELVLQQELPIGADGTIEVEIDTLMAKELYSDSDHRYSITAEVRDESRRTIVGKGNVLVARKPFKVFTWVNRGYYHVNDNIQANFLAQTLDNRPVKGSGRLKLFRVTYNKDKKPTETLVQSWDLDTDAEGRAEQQIRASRNGQYRLSYTVTDVAEHKIEGGYLFTVVGEGFDGADYRFNRIELIPEKAEYRPGETVRLQINTDRPGSTVQLFIRPTNGVYLPPRTIRLKGKSQVVDIDVVKKDMPNFFVEATTVSDGKVHSETKEIVVPPEKRILNVDVEPSQQEFLPGQKGEIKVRLTDDKGENFVGTTVIAVYDKAVEYIAGGSNSKDIKSFFWKWRRRHNSRSYTNIRQTGVVRPANTREMMRAIGVHGHNVASDLDAMEGGEGVVSHTINRQVATGLRSRRGGLGGGGAMDMGGGFAAPMGGGGMGGFGGAPGAKGRASNSLAMAAEAEDAIGPGGGGSTPQTVQPEIRSNFADTALWVGSITTNKVGEATVPITMPENLTAWKVKVWGLGHGTRVGSGEAEVVTRKNIILRLQAPRFVIERDEVVLSANVHNYLKQDKEVEVKIELPTDELVCEGETTQKIMVPAGGDTRVDWTVKAKREGIATIRMAALTDVESDAMEIKIPCYVHGALKMESWAGTLRPEDGSATLTVSVPSQRKVEQSRLEIRYSPTLAAAMVDALPYLVDYPYGCTEQTLNRFLPTVVTQKFLLDRQVNLEQIRNKRTNLNAQEIGDDRERAKQWKRFNRNPVFDEQEVAQMVKDGLKRLTNMQNGDGGWGWFSGLRERSYPHTTSVVVHGLQIAQQNDVALVPGVLDRGIEWLKRYQAKELQKRKNAASRTQPYKSSCDNIDAFVYMILVDAKMDNGEMRDFLYKDRNNLAVYSKAMFGLALHKTKQADKLNMIMRNIEQYLVQDEENETAFLRLPADTYWWYWYGSETEANAYYLKLLSKLNPKGKTAPRLVKYLLNNRKHGTYWRSTRDTAVCVEAFADYLKATNELSPKMTVEVWVDGKKAKEVPINSDNLFTFDNKFVMVGKELAAGAHKIEIRRSGQGPVYFNAYLTNFTMEDHIKKAGLEVKVLRDIYRLVPETDTRKAAASRGQPVDQKKQKYTRVKLKDGESVKSGELVEVELTIHSKNDYEYLLFEDRKAAGFEPVDVRSGYMYEGLMAYRELRDDRVSFFIRRLPRGQSSVSYRLRAETPGKFSALPARGYAMYAPELKGNSDEIKLRVSD